MICPWFSTRLVPCFFFGLGLLLVGPARAGDFWVDGRKGKDVLQGGGTRTAPWKTLDFALYRVSPPGNPKEVHTIHVVGSQVYAVTQTLPLKFHVRLVGEGNDGKRPILRGTLLLPSLFSAATRTRLDCLSGLDNLILEGGKFALMLGASGQGRHRPSFRNCEFRGAKEAEVLIQEKGSQACQPLFADCRFQGSSVGIRAVAMAAGAQLSMVLEGCRFEGMKGRNVEGVDRTRGKASLGLEAKDCSFLGGLDGVYLESGGNRSGTRMDLLGCAFSGCRGRGVEILVRGSNDPQVRIEGTSFIGCGSGIVLGGSLPAGVYTFALRRNLIAQSKGDGVSVRFSRQGGGSVLLRYLSEANLSLQNALDGFVWAFPTDIDLFLDSFRDRAMENGFRGIFLQGGKVGSKLRIRGGILARNGRSGMQFFTVGQMTLRFMTMADNGWFGLFYLGSSFPRSWAFDHCIFANNKRADASIPRTFPITYSLFQNQIHFGKGNLNARPKLARPSYHLLPGSPCIDAGAPLPLAPSIDFEGDPRLLAGESGKKIYDMGADEFSPHGSGHAYGLSGLGRQGFRPRIGMLGSAQDARIGQPLGVTLSGARSPFARQAALAVPLLGHGEYGPKGFLDLARTGAPGSQLWQTTLLILPPIQVDAKGKVQLDLRIPNSKRLQGLDLSIQWWG